MLPVDFIEDVTCYQGNGPQKQVKSGGGHYTPVPHAQVPHPVEGDAGGYNMYNALYRIQQSQRLDNDIFQQVTAPILNVGGAGIGPAAS